MSCVEQPRRAVRLPSRVRSGRLAVPPIRPPREERAKIRTDLFHGRPPHIPPPVIDLVDTQVAVEQERVRYRYWPVNWVGRVDDIQLPNNLSIRVAQKRPRGSDAVADFFGDQGIIHGHNDQLAVVHDELRLQVRYVIQQLAAALGTEITTAKHDSGRKAANDRRQLDNFVFMAGKLNVRKLLTGPQILFHRITSSSKPLEFIDRRVLDTDQLLTRSRSRRLRHVGKLEHFRRFTKGLDQRRTHWRFSPWT